MESVQENEDAEDDSEEEEEEEESEEAEDEEDESQAVADTDASRADHPPSGDVLAENPAPQASSSISLPPLLEVHPSSSRDIRFVDPILSPINRSRPLSRSPPASRHFSPAPSTRSHSRSPSRSRSDSPSSLAGRTAALSLGDGQRGQESIRERAATEASKHRAKQQRKYHSKRGAQRVGGRQKGSKAKMDTRVKPDRGGFWD